MDAKIRITVLRRTLNEDCVKEFATHGWEKCEKFSEGQVFISSGLLMPEGFCSWAWTDILKIVMTLARGGNFLGTKRGTFVTCCTDGFRPVLFKIERIEDTQA